MEKCVWMGRRKNNTNMQIYLARSGNECRSAPQRESEREREFEGTMEKKENKSYRVGGGNGGG